MQTNLHSIAAGSDAQGLKDHVAVRIVGLSEVLSRIATRTIEARWGLRNTDLRMLNTLDGEEAVAVSEIARRVYVDKAWVSRSLRDLEARGLIVRKPDPLDSRQTLVSLSDFGKSLLEEVRPYALRSEMTLLDGIDARALKTMLDRLAANANAVLHGLK